MVIHQNISLVSYNTFHIDVTAQYFVDVHELADIREIYEKPIFRPLPKLVIGGGSNILFTGNQRKVVMRMAIPGMTILREDQHHVYVQVGAGESWHNFVMWCVGKGFGGIENLSLIPGTVGAAPMQNIGAYGVEIREAVETLEAYEIASGQLRVFENERCQFGYRYSIFKGELKDKYIITSVTFRLQKKPRFNVEYGDLRRTLDEMGVQQLSVRAVSDAVIRIRQSKLPDPAVMGNAGSFFKNPIIEATHFEAIKALYPEAPSFPVSENWIKVPAAWLIDKCKWKGLRDGKVGVHEKQPLVLVNYGKGKGKEILELSEKIQSSVQKNFGIELHREVNVV